MSGKPSLRTPLGRVRSLGSAKSGTGDFWRQRLSAVATMLLTIPVIVIVMMLLGRNHAYAALLLGNPFVAVVLMLFVLASCIHMKIGIQIVIEDYIHDEKLKLMSIIANNFFTIAVGLTSVYALIKLSSGV